MQVVGHPASIGSAGVPPQGRTSGAGQPAVSTNFSDLLSDVSKAPDATATPAEQGEADEIARMRTELDAYKRDRDKVEQGRRMDPPAYQIALPVNDRGYMPYVTADQQTLMDRVTDSYLGRPEHEMEKMWEELKANGVHPEQRARTAKYFVNLEGEIVNRDIATGNQRSARQGSTAWMASGV